MKRRLIFLLWFTIFAASFRDAFSADQILVPKPKERDPMIPQEMSLFQQKKQAAAKKVEKSTFQVQGVGRGPRGVYAIIDNQAYREGETKKGITVVKIGETEVDILSDGIPESLPIKK